MSRKLIKELIMSRLGSDKLDSIKTLNLWGNNIDDISLLSEMPSLEILSLSTNHIQDLKPLKNLKNLKELYLQDNNISDINQIEFLKNCKQLEILNLSENPITKFQNYRQKVLNILPFLKRLDDIENTNIFQHNKFSFHQNPLMFFKKIFPKRVNKQNNINDLNNSINLDEINNQRNTVNNRNDILNKSFKKKKYIGTFKIGNKKSETNNMNISFDSDPNKYNKKIIKKNFQEFDEPINNDKNIDKNNNNKIKEDIVIQSIKILLGTLNLSELKLVNEDITNILKEKIV
jgi:Leucine-rich repeat (LRR) protein